MADAPAGSTTIAPGPASCRQLTGGSNDVELDCGSIGGTTFASANLTLVKVDALN